VQEARGPVRRGFVPPVPPVLLSRNRVRERKEGEGGLGGGVPLFPWGLRHEVPGGPEGPSNLRHSVGR
jgi:hypothetical protein